MFTDKATKPTQNDVGNKLNTLYPIWERIYQLVYSKYRNGVDGWNYPGKKYGWSFLIKDKKRAIIYFLPRDGYFKVAFVFGQKAYDEIMQSNISEAIKTDLSQAKKYSEGRGVQINITNDHLLTDIEQLIEIKLKY
ncbi:DUF3788 domain-containing protein [Marinifilum sp. N1E240]|uniref:DUF3788 domain-containing protein n=1 Tax=Marinifilum sp. N1E240 TaxID=2608082 RepID=UPI0026107805|nr:DUF3788 domain-containing protein [uncultured Marinifilum sp.]